MKEQLHKFFPKDSMERELLIWLAERDTNDRNHSLCSVTSVVPVFCSPRHLQTAHGHYTVPSNSSSAAGKHLRPELLF